MCVRAFSLISPLLHVDILITKLAVRVKLLAAAPDEVLVEPDKLGDSLGVLLSGSARRVDMSALRESDEFLIRELKADVVQSTLCAVPFCPVVRDEIAKVPSTANFKSFALEADTFCEIAYVERSDFEECVSEFWPAGVSLLKQVCIHLALSDLPEEGDGFPRDIATVASAIWTAENKSSRESVRQVKADGSITERVDRLEQKLGEVDSMCQKSFKSLDDKLSAIMQKLS